MDHEKDENSDDGAKDGNIDMKGDGDIMAGGLEEDIVCC